MGRREAGGFEEFEILVEDEVLVDLKERIRNTRWPNQIEGAGWSYGTELGFLKEFCEFWAEEFDWMVWESRLNSFRNLRTEIGGQPIHVLVADSPHPEAKPLLITHGWPGSVIEFLDVLGPLSDPTAHGGSPEDAFHVIAPSLPGFAWSGPTFEPGWDVLRVAEAWAELMASLGHDHYFAQGGDWGSMVSTWLGRIDSGHLDALHLNMAIGIPAEGDLDDQELADLAAATEFLQTGCAYQEIQGKNPQTLGYGLTDSPAGLAGWILEKFWAWTDNDGLPTDAISMDALAANLTTYWVTNTISSSVRIYFESMKSGRFGTQDGKVEVPTSIALYNKEIIKAPRPWLEAGYEVKRITRFERGGHFAAMEQPQFFVDDLRASFRPYR
jgi:microsomal epoxide hydrolase